MPPLQVDYGFMAGHLEHFTENPETLAARFTERIERNPDDFEAYHHRAHARVDQGRLPDAVADLSRAIALRPDEAHHFFIRGQIYFQMDRADTERAILDLEKATELDPSRDSIRRLLARYCNAVAWELARKLPSGPELGRALGLSRRSVELVPGLQESLNTRGVVLYRAGQYADAVKTLDASLEAGRGEFDAFDLYFLAMSHHRLGHREEARRCLDPANAWVSRRGSLTDQYTRELAEFRREAEAVLASPIGELPDDVFQRP